MLQLQHLPLDAKILMSQQRIREWYNYFHGYVMVSFSGGKDSTVLAHLVHEMYPNVPLVFANTGLEYPEIQAFAKKMGAEFVRPKMRFDEVITKYGYPIISKEVAEAIHAARYIVSKNHESLDFVERERESPWQSRRRNDLRGVPRRYSKRNGRNGQTRSEASFWSADPYTRLCGHSQDQATHTASTYSACVQGQRKVATIDTTGRTGDEKACSG